MYKDMEYEEKRPYLKNKNIWIIVALIVLCAGLLAFVLVPKFYSKNDDAHVHDDGAIDDDTLQQIFPVFENEYQLNYSIGKTVASKVFAVIGRVIANTTALGKDSRQIIATLEETSFKKEPVDSGYAYSFTISVLDSDNNIGETQMEDYQVWVWTDETYGNSYYCSLVNKDKTGYLNITIAPGKDEQERKEIVGKITDWAKGLMPNCNISLTVTDS